MNEPPDPPEPIPPGAPLPGRDEQDIPWDRWLLRKRLGAGAMGTVYEAVPLARPGTAPCALKVVTAAPGSAEFEAHVRRFTDREVALAASVAHPNVVCVHESGTGADGRPFLAMELLGGGSLLNRSAEFREFHRGAGVVLGLARALVALRGAGVLHRDVKPSNLVFRGPGDPPDAVVLTDFGLARGPGTSFTRTSTFFGTLNYASPEQLLSAKDVDHRTDIYSAGVLLFWLLTGRYPFKPAASNLPSDHRAVRLDRPLDLEDLRPDAPQLLGDVCRVCLQCAPADRYQDARDLAHDLETAIASTRAG